SIYMPASYDMLEDLLAFAASKKCQHILDLGCGKGRALCVAAHYGFRQLTGIDISKSFLTTAKENIESTIQTLEIKPEYKLHHADAYYFEIPDSCDCVFLFNPFNDVIMSGVAENISLSLRRNPRTMFILYKNPLHKEFFTANNFVEIYHKQKLRYLEGIVMVSAAGDEISL
ncbi:MAG: class I SAM-dependent methyltransferase, partial [Sphingobacteriales bacterium]